MRTVCGRSSRRQPGISSSSTKHISCATRTVRATRWVRESAGPRRPAASCCSPRRRCRTHYSSCTASRRSSTSVSSAMSARSGLSMPVPAAISKACGTGSRFSASVPSATRCWIPVVDCCCSYGSGRTHGFSSRPAGPRTGARLHGSATDDHRLTELGPGQNLESRWNERKQVQKAIAARHQDDHCDSEHRELLFVLKASVDRQEDVELACGKAQQFTVALAGPPRLRHGLHFVPDQGVLQSSRQALVKQDTHESAERPSPVPER